MRVKSSVYFPESAVRAKVYSGRRFMYGVNVSVVGDGYMYPLSNEGGIDWGQGTRYSKKLAHVILMDFAGQAVADTYACDFDDDFISCMPMQGFSLPGEAIKEWLEEKGKGHNRESIC